MASSVRECGVWTGRWCHADVRSPLTGSYVRREGKKDPNSRYRARVGARPQRHPAQHNAEHKHLRKHKIKAEHTQRCRERKCARGLTRTTHREVHVQHTCAQTEDQKRKGVPSWWITLHRMLAWTECARWQTSRYGNQNTRARHRPATGENSA